MPDEQSLPAAAFKREIGRKLNAFQGSISAPSTIKALLIDLDGTLVNTLPLLFKVYKNFLKKYGIKGNKKEFDELNGPALDEVLSILQKRYQLTEDTPSLLKHYQQEIALCYSYNLPLFPHALQTIIRAKNKGLKIGLVSSAKKSLVEAFVSGQKMEKIFDTLITPEGLFKSKPSPEIYQRALLALKVSPKEALAVEDSIHGVQSARKAGIFTLWITHKKGRTQIKETDDPWCIQVRDWNAIDQFLERYDA